MSAQKKAQLNQRNRNVIKIPIINVQSCTNISDVDTLRNQNLQVRNYWPQFPSPPPPPPPPPGVAPPGPP